MSNHPNRGQSGPSPTPAEIRALLDSAKPPLSAYAAARIIKISERHMQDACAGTRNLKFQAWTLLRLTLSASARKELPEPVAP